MFIFLLICIFLPMFLFSDFNPASEVNQINNGYLSVGIRSFGPQGINYYELFESSNIVKMANVTRNCRDCDWEKYRFGEIP